ncbi:carboxypeptidase-like regulatory domain-containing protein [Pseudoxanthomonas suwonensis]|uniref:carboxypeptidase-like regulatory domain-containing protein n=1 Tax=Pseudoxanthomonas suwonensis TaxID=314722 RepID=UPI00048D2C0A|nr:carboxypeptidase-like regulatory domain-containing protein [Pseudoxanthomonas suwonensis]
MTKGPTGGRVRLTALSLALAACISGGAHAQSNTTGTISGQAGSGDTITAISDVTGFQRSITAGADGSFRFSSLPAGRYRITRTGPDGTATTREVVVNTGTGSSVSFADAATSILDAVQVRGMAAVNPIDLSSVESTTIFTEAQLDAATAATATSSPTVSTTAPAPGSGARARPGAAGGPIPTSTRPPAASG